MPTFKKYVFENHIVSINHSLNSIFWLFFFPQILLIGCMLVWTTNAIYGRYGSFSNRYYPSHSYSNRNVYRKYNAPVSYCMKMVYGRDVYLNHPYSYAKPIKSLSASNVQGVIKKTYGNMFMTIDELKKALGINRSDFINWTNGVHAPNRTSGGSSGGGPFQINSDICCSTWV